jgi:hypothetical protein
MNHATQTLTNHESQNMWKSYWGCDSEPIRFPHDYCLANDLCGTRPIYSVPVLLSFFLLRSGSEIPILNLINQQDLAEGSSS